VNHTHWDQLDRAYTLLARTLKNDLAALNFCPDKDCYGFILRDANDCYRRALYTVYITPHGASAYIAVCDRRGYDVADERPLLLNATISAVVARIKADHQQIYPHAYPRIRERWEGAADELRSLDCYRPGSPT
jgi:hypothetical protein